MSMRESFKRGFREGLLKKYFRRVWGHRIWKRNNKREVAFLEEIRFFPEEVINYIFSLAPKTLIDTIEAINAWCSLEVTMTGNEDVHYVIGNAEQLFKMILNQRDEFIRNTMDGIFVDNIQKNK